MTPALTTPNFSYQRSPYRLRISSLQRPCLDNRPSTPSGLEIGAPPTPSKNILRASNETLLTARVIGQVTLHLDALLNRDAAHLLTADSLSPSLLVAQL